MSNIRWADRTRTGVLLFIAAALGAAVVAGCRATPALGSPERPLTVRSLSRSLDSMPAARDCSTPEGAYAAVTRAVLERSEDLATLFARSIRSRVPKGKLKALSEARQAALRNLRLEEVREAGDGAAVIATVNGEVLARYFVFEDGRWASLGEDGAADMDEARNLAARFLASRPVAPEAARPDPEASLASCVKYLQQSGQSPKEFLLAAMQAHRLTAIGELHHRPQSWATYREVVEDPRFAAHVGTLYMELPRHAQLRIDRFMAAATLDVAPVVDTLRDISDTGTPDQSMVDFLSALWKVNRALPAASKVRVRLVDQSWDWEKVRTAADLKQLVCDDRDGLMAQTILDDLEADGRGRNAVFMVGYLHLPSGLTLRVDPKTRYQSAGERLRQKLGAQLFTLVQHGPILANGGAAYGRTRQGLFDEAFARIGERPVAFPLAGSPFGKEPFDSAYDLRGYAGTYGSTFDGYLYLGPLEQERFAPLVPGFYSKAYAREVDRRCRLVHGGSLKEVQGVEAPPEALTAGSLRVCGQPRDWIAKLGPRDAWRMPNVKH
jgi:hypothetical protein